MRTYSILYRPAGGGDASPLLLKVSAPDAADARLQCEARYPGCTVVLVR